MSDAVARVAAALGAGRAGLFSDIDGTISPIAATPGQAVVDPGCRDALRALATHLALVAVVSGRAVADARRMVNLSGIVYVGNHGFEVWRDGSLWYPAELHGYPKLLDGLRDRLTPLLQRKGILFEHKGPTASIHYRNAADPEGTRLALLDAIGRDPVAGRVRVTEGRMVVEIRPLVERNKGIAVADLIRAHGLSGAVYLGDDRTDLDAFRSLHALQKQGTLASAVAVGVRGAETPADVLTTADVIVDGMEGVRGLLSRIFD